MGNLTCTASGSVANFYTPYAVPIRSFKVHFSPKQSGSGDPSPSNVRPIDGWTGVTGYRDKKSVVWNQWLKPLSGDNWYGYNSTVTDVVFNDGIATSTWLTRQHGYRGSIRTKVGTSQTQGDVLYVSYMVNPSLEGLNWGVEFGYNSQATCIQNAPANIWQRCSCIARCNNTGNNYTYISYCRSTIPNDGLIAQTKSPILINLTQMFGAGNEPETAEEFEAQCALNGINLDEYQAYDEGTAIGWKTADTDEIPISFPAVGKNIWDEVWNFGAINTTTGAPAPNPNSTRIYSVNYIPVIPGVRYFASPAQWIALYDKDKNIITDWNPEGVTRSDNVYNMNRFTAPDNCYYFRFYTPASYAEGYKNTGFVVRNDEPDKTYEPYLGNTFYSGSIDLITGELVQEYGCVELGDLSWVLSSVSNCFRSSLTNHKYTEGINIYCEKYKSVKAYGISAQQMPDFSIKTHSTNNTDIYIKDSNYSTAEDFQSAMSNEKLVYELETPIIKYIAPQTLSTLVHSNAFWSNADSVEIEYDLAECGDIKEIRRRILLNTPHLETVSGSVAHFTTDMAAKLKELKVNFLPQQAGSGDPSPSNVRAISGWTGCDVVHSGKNLFDENACRFGYWTNSSGVVSENNKGVLSANIPINPNQAVSLSFYGETPYSYSIIELDENLGFLFRTHKSIQDHSIVSPGTLTLTTGASTRYIYIQTYDNANTTITQEILASFKLQLELGSQSTAYEPYQSNQITVSWDNLGTIYGGFIDVLRGELVQEWEMTSARWGDIRNDSPHETTGLYEGFVNFSNRIIVSHSASDDGINIICNATSNCSWNGPERGGNHYFSGNIANSKLGRVYAYFDSTLDDNATLQFCSRLETPITYPLTPETIKALKDVNNVFSDANGDVEVKYYKH